MGNEPVEAVLAALESKVTVENGRCWTCDRVSCKVNSSQAERDRAWGAFDTAKARANGYLPEHESLRDAAFESSKATTAAEDDCTDHKVNWRIRALTAEARIEKTKKMGQQIEKADGP